MDLCKTLVQRACIALWALGAPAAGQTFAELAGFVRDPEGAAVGNARVVAVNIATGRSRSTQAGARGDYVIPLLLPGAYRVTASLDGFRPETLDRVEAGLGARVRADFQLDIGPVTDEVDVVAHNPLLRRDNADVSTVIEERRLRELPLAERNYTALLGLASNAATQIEPSVIRVARQGGGRAELAVAVAGQRQAFNHYSLDGVENTNVNFNTYMVRPSIDAVSEVRVQTGVYSAQYGRAVSQVLVGTKSGSNELHGALFEFHKNENFNAKPWRSTQVLDPFASNQLGLVVGGPVVRNPVFFLSNVEVRRDHTNVPTRANVPASSFRGGDFTRATRPIFDPLTRRFEGTGDQIRAVSADPFPNQMIPAARQSGVARALLEFYPEPNVSESGVNYRGSEAQRIDTEQYLQRFDFEESDGSRWTARLNHGNERTSRPDGQFPTQSARVDTTTYQFMASNTRSLSPKALNELRVGYNRFRNDFVGHFAYERDVVAELGIADLAAPDPSAWGLPAVGLARWTPFGGSTNGPWSNRDHTLQFLNNTSVVARGHSLKFGVEWRRDAYNQVAAHSATGLFIFQGEATGDPGARRGSTGDSFADFLLGAPDSAARVVSLYQAGLRAASWSFYLQDTWRAARRLTVDWGVRYEFTPPYRDADRGIVNAHVFDMGVGPGGLLADTRTPVLTRPGDGDFYDGLEFRYDDAIPVQSGDQHLGRRLVASDGNDWAPRLGIVYSPADRWVIRSGFGVFYSQDIGQPRFEMARNLSGLDRRFANRQRPDLALEAPWSAALRGTACSDWDGLCLTQPFLFNNVYGRRTPYVMQWMFDVQRRLGDSLRVQAGYHGNGGRRLERMRPFNQAVNRSGPSDDSSVQDRQPWPEYGILQEVDGVVNSNYHALNLKLEKRFSGGAAFTAGYTWSKSIDSGSAIRNSRGDRLFPPNQYNLAPERGLSQFHIGQRFVTSFLYELPFGRGRTWLSGSGLASKIAGGWQVGGVFSLSEGPAYGTGGIGRPNDTGVINFPDATGISPVVDHPTPERYWNIDAFDRSNPELEYRAGNVGRTVLPGPGLVNWDASLLRNIRVREGQTLQLRFEAFNAANHPNWGMPGRDVRNRSTFGRISDARPMRILQFGVKYLF